MGNSAQLDAAAAAAAPEAEAANLSFDAAKPFQDVYADSLQVASGPFGITLTFALTDPQDQAHRDIVSRVRMSPQMGFVLAQLLRKVIQKANAEGIGTSVPDSVTSALGIDKEL